MNNEEPVQSGPAKDHSAGTQPSAAESTESVVEPAEKFEITGAESEMEVETDDEAYRKRGGSKDQESAEPDLHLTRIEEQIHQLHTEFQGKLKYDQHKDAIIDKLHGELQGYKNDLVLKLLRPFITDVIQTMDDIARQVSHYRAREEAQLAPAKILRDLDSFGGDLEDLLFRQGVDSFQTLEEQFDPKQQKVVKRVITDDPEKDKTIASRVRKGFRWEGRVIRPEMVDVYIYRPSQSQSANEE